MQTTPSQHSISQTTSQTLAEFLDMVLGVLVIYRQSLAESTAWNSLLAELTRLQTPMEIFVYDNSPEPQSIPSSPWCVSHYVHDASNPGVSMAYNQGHRFAFEQKKDWLFLLDQDTALPTGSLESYGSAVKQNSSESLFVPTLIDTGGILSPFLFSLGGGRRLRRKPPALLPTNRYRMMNSGMLIRSKAFGEAGGYDLEIPLDFSDIAFIEKMKRNVSRAVLVDCSCVQNFSSTTTGDLNGSLERFRWYAHGAVGFARRFGGAPWIYLRSLLRAVRFAIHFGTWKFVGLHMNTWHRR